MIYETLCSAQFISFREIDDKLCELARLLNINRVMHNRAVDQARPRKRIPMHCVSLPWFCNRTFSSTLRQSRWALSLKGRPACTSTQATSTRMMHDMHVVGVTDNHLPDLHKYLAEDAHKKKRLLGGLMPFRFLYAAPKSHMKHIHSCAIQRRINESQAPW